jgi:hypothetical protein
MPKKVEVMMPEIRNESCRACPYRRDVPSGVWAASEYDKLAEYDAPTGEQPYAAFYCHATPEAICHGWVVVSKKNDHAHDLLGLRILASMGKFDYGEIDLVEERTPLFDFGTEACEHGKRDIENPSEEALEVVARLGRKYDRLRYS